MPIPAHLQRAARLGAVSLGAALALTGPAAAQSRCGASYSIQPGDTLYRVAQSCRVSLSRIMDLNPGLDPRDLSVGTRLQLVAGGSGDGADSAPPRDPGGRYRVQSGDTMADVAARFGVSLFELLNSNEEADPFSLAVGELLDIPGDGPAATVSVSPQSGPPGSRVTVSARHLRPADYVTVGVGERASEWRGLREVRVGDDGAVTVEVTAPDWSEPGDALIFVVDTDRGQTLKSDVFDVTRGQPGAPISYEGRLRAGAECPVLVTRDGDRYALTSSRVGLTPGEYVRIEARPAEMAYCMADTPTLRVSAIEEIAPPDGNAGGSGGDRMRLEGRVRAGVECPLLVTPDGDRYALTSERPITPGEYVEVRGRRADISYCQEGRATISVDRIREVAPPAGDHGPGRGDEARLDAGYMVGPWAARGGDCRRPDFDVTRTGTSGLTVETSINGAPRTGYVALGDAPAFIFDQPRREFPLDRRGPDGVAVGVPDSGSARLGGRLIEGDGRVFIQC